MTRGDEAALEAVWDAIEKARCPGREGPYGLYDYSKYPGDGPPHHVRDFRDPQSDDWGKTILATWDGDEARFVYEKLTRFHIALAAIAAVRAFAATLENRDE